MVFAWRCLGPAVFRNEVVTSEMTHRKLGWTYYMIPVSITLPNHLIKASCWLRYGDYRCRFQGKINTLRTLSSRHGIELGFFFTGVESHESQRRTWISKSYPLEIFQKNSYERPPKWTVCFVEIVVFAWRCLGPAVFRNEVVTSKITQFSKEHAMRIRK